MEPSDYVSIVNLDPSHDSVTAKALLYRSSLPLLFINSSKIVTIREYICGEFVQRFTEDMHLELRWMQRFGRASKINDATWILDDIKIRLWNGVCFIQVLNEDFSRTPEIINGSYDLQGAYVQIPSCESSINGSALDFSESFNETLNATVTRRSMIINNLFNIADSCEVKGFHDSKFQIY